MAFYVRPTHANVPLVVLCVHRKEGPLLKVFNPMQQIRESSAIFQQKYRERGVGWDELCLQAPDIPALGDSTTLQVRNEVYRVSVSLKEETIQLVSGQVEVLRLVLSLG